MQEHKRSIVIFTYVAIFSLIVPAIFWLLSSRPGEQNTAVSPPQEQASVNSSSQD